MLASNSVFYSKEYQSLQRKNACCVLLSAGSKFDETMKK